MWFAPDISSYLTLLIFIDIIAGTSSLCGLCIMLSAFLLWYKEYYGMMPWQRGSRNRPRIELFLQNQGTAHPKKVHLLRSEKSEFFLARKPRQKRYQFIKIGEMSTLLTSIIGRNRTCMDKVATEPSYQLG
jgi:hypothetical protein